MRDLAAAKTTDERQAIISDRLMWGEMRMDPTDLADVTGYTFLVNGRGPTDNWTGLFRPGEKVRLRFINGSAMTIFDARIPGLRMKVVQADGNDVEPVAVDEFRMGVGETYDVIVEPREDRAYTIEAQSIDRRGFARATLAPRPGMAGPLPVLRPPGVLGAADMGHGGMDHSKMDPSKTDQSTVDHSKMDHSKMDMAAMAKSDPAGFAHVPPVDAPAGTKVLGYGDLRRLDRGYRLAPPDRTIELRLTGNMERYYWSFDDRKYSEQPTIDFTEGETVRLVFRNETMMNHPLHLHGLWMDLDNGAGEARPRKHVVIVPPGRTVSVTVTMAAVGRWPFHCHLLFHMTTGMFREFAVHPKGEALPAAWSTPAREAAMRIISAGGAPLQWRDLLWVQTKTRRWSGAPPAMTVLALAAIFLAAPALAMDDQATFWRFDGRVEKRLTSLAPATDWATSAWIGDDSTKLRLQNSGVIDNSGHIDNEGGTGGIDNRFFYSRRISDFWDAKAGVQFTVFDQGVTRSGFIAGVEGSHPTASTSTPCWG